MSSTFFLAILCLGVGSGALAFDPSLDAEWHDWKTEHEKSYTMEEGHRRAIWEENMKMIKLHNRENSLGKNGFIMEMNEFGDLTAEEFRKMMVNIPIRSHRKGKIIRKRDVGNVLPKFVDWRKEGYVTRVRNQKFCNSCWAFAVTGAIEGQMFNKTGQLTPLSVQNLVDCTKSQGNEGCQWGDPYIAYEYVLNNGGLEAEATYPYKGKEGVCMYNPKHSKAEITGFVSLPESEDILMEAVATIGPISVAVDASFNSFGFYKKGLYDEPNCSNNTVNHAVLVVGYGFEGNETDGNSYWLIKNSWGRKWGLRGYMKIPKDQNNFCGIASYAHYPTV
ncbi:cathepsin R-like isoform X2 [Rattus rattus]|uniref:cathepsin R-like isoform X2 n=1 Tax=Rattus rattus TaxID=10117 RepID=UPI0013F3757B|nr:cathepsin R-like isoform X2 [Rattus rattus]